MVNIGRHRRLETFVFMRIGELQFEVSKSLGAVLRCQKASNHRVKGPLRQGVTSRARKGGGGEGGWLGRCTILFWP